MVMTSSRPLDSGPPTVPFLPPSLSFLCKGKVFGSIEQSADIRDKGQSLVGGMN